MAFDFKQLAQLAVEHGTPLYVYDLDSLADNFKTLKQTLLAAKLPHSVHFAVKANGNLAILNFLKQFGSGFDIVSAGELKRVLAAGGKGEQVIFSGVGKSREEITFALKENLRMIAVESAAELSTIISIAKELKLTAPVGLRINPEIDPQTHKYIATGIKESKFGIPFNEALQLFKTHRHSPQLNWMGITFHIGSQILTLEPFKALAKLARHYHDEFVQAGMPANSLVDVGGGCGIAYRAEEKAPSLKDYCQIFCDAFTNGFSGELVLEPGRALIGNCGVLLTSVLYEKTNGVKRFVVLDTGMGELIRPALYEAYHQIVPLDSALNSSPTSVADYVGPYCESSDCLAKERSAPSFKGGEVLAILSAGAYGFAMASNYNAHCRPAEVAIFKGKAHLVRAREQFVDLIAGEKVVSFV